MQPIFDEVKDTNKREQMAKKQNFFWKTCTISLKK